MKYLFWDDFTLYMHGVQSFFFLKKKIYWGYFLDPIEYWTYIVKIK